MIRAQPVVAKADPWVVELQVTTRMSVRYTPVFGDVIRPSKVVNDPCRVANAHVSNHGQDPAVRYRTGGAVFLVK